MPRQTTIISVFLASPSDVTAERKIVTRAIDRWNTIRGRSQGYLLELLTWELSTSSAVGSDGQDVVNSQIGDEYDAMVAIFWSRLGSETPRADSGTVEEYERALQRHKRGDPIEVGVYFKTADPPMDKIDPMQLKGVFDLKTQMESDGVYHKSFKDDEALNFEIELFLEKLVRHHQTSKPALTTTNPSDPEREIAPLNQSNVASADESLGYLDILDSLEGHTARMTAFLQSSSRGVEEINEVVTRGAQRFTELAALGSPDPAEVRKVVQEVTEVFNSFSDTIEDGITEFSASMAGAASDSLDMIRVSFDFDNDAEDIERAGENLSYLLSSIDSVTISMSEFSDSVRGLQRMTVAFNKARNRVVLNVDKMVEVISSSKSIIAEALAILPAKLT